MRTKFTIKTVNIELQLNGKTILSEQFSNGDRFYRPRFLTRALVYKFTDDLEMLGEIRSLVRKMQDKLTMWDTFTEIEEKKGKTSLKLIWGNVDGTDL